jgi:hypothetical protein
VTKKKLGFWLSALNHDDIVRKRMNKIFIIWLYNKKSFKVQIQLDKKNEIQILFRNLGRPFHESRLGH